MGVRLPRRSRPPPRSGAVLALFQLLEPLGVQAASLRRWRGLRVAVLLTHASARSISRGTNQVPRWSSGEMIAPEKP